MRIVVVKFSGSDKAYEFRTNLQLIPDGEYKITADGDHTYTTNVIVIGYRREKEWDGMLREITRADCVKAPQAREDFVENIWFNEEKGTTVVKWKDGVITKVTCSPNDNFDKEKGVALCYMKRFFRNRGAFNEVLKKWCND